VRLKLTCEFAAPRPRGKHARHTTEVPSSSCEVQDPAPAAVESAAAKVRSGKSPSSGKASTPAAANEGATIARRLAAALVKPGVDSSLDCELGIMRALTERNQQATDIPLELLWEWTLVAVQRRDCGLLGRAMTLASAAGHSMAGLLGGFGSLASVLCEITTVFKESTESREGSSGSSETDAKISDSSSTASSSTPPCPLLPMGAAGAPPQSGLPSLPASMCWLHDHSAGAQLGLVKHVVNGVATFFSNKAFESYVVSRENLQASWQAKGRPSTELFIHPDDVFKVCSHVGRLWKGLALTMVRNGPVPGGAVGPGGTNAAAVAACGTGSFPLALDTVKECAREVPDVVRLWVTWPRRGYVLCRARVHLVVTVNPQGEQSSHLAFGFRAQAPAESYGSSDHSSSSSGGQYGQSAMNARGSQASPTEQAGIGVDVRSVGGGMGGSSSGGVALSVLGPSMVSPRSGLPDAFAFGAAMAAASRSSSSSFSSAAAPTAASDDDAALSSAAAAAAEALSSLSSFTAPSGVTFSGLPASQADASTSMADAHHLRSSNSEPSSSSSFSSSSSSTTSSALAMLRARLAPLDTGSNAPAGCVTSSVDWGNIGLNGSFIVNGSFVVPSTMGESENAVDNDDADNQSAIHGADGAPPGELAGVVPPPHQAFPPSHQAGLPVPTPPANGAQFFGGKGEEFWDAVTILGKDA